jgi:hypothetical protein
MGCCHMWTPFWSFVHPSSWCLRSSEALLGLCYSLRLKLNLPATNNPARDICYNVIIRRRSLGPSPTRIVAWRSLRPSMNRAWRPWPSKGEVRRPTNRAWSLDSARTWPFGLQSRGLRLTPNSILLGNMCLYITGLHVFERYMSTLLYTKASMTIDHMLTLSLLKQSIHCHQKFKAWHWLLSWQVYVNIGTAEATYVCCVFAYSPDSKQMRPMMNRGEVGGRTTLEKQR